MEFVTIGRLVCDLVDLECVLNVTISCQFLHILYISVPIPVENINDLVSYNLIV